MTWVALAILIPAWFIAGVSVLQFLLQEIGEVIRQVQGKDALYSPIGDVAWAAGCLTAFVFLSLALVAINIPVI